MKIPKEKSRKKSFVIRPHCFVELTSILGEKLATL